MTMRATVLLVQQGRIIVLDHATGQRVVVNTSMCGCRVRPGDNVLIRYSGAMTRSIPPQITAISITPLNRFIPWCDRCR